MIIGNLLSRPSATGWLMVFGILSCFVFSKDASADNCKNVPESGRGYSIINQGSGFALDVSHESRSHGANVIQWSYKASDNQHFMLTDIGNGYWSIQAYHSGLVVDVEGASAANGANILQWGYHDGENQQWQLKQDGSGAFNIVSRSSGHLMTVSNGNIGGNVYQQANQSSSFQRWYLNPVDGQCDNNPTPPPSPVVGSCDGSSTLSRGDSHRIVYVGGEQRSYFLHVPGNYSGNNQVPLIIDYHGFGGNGEGEKNWSGFDRESESNGFIVAYPDGIGGTWNNRVPARDGADDIGFARAIVKDLQSNGCIDLKRVYAAGYSMGGGMAYASACRAADLFAAIVSSSFDFYADQQCQPVRPISVLSFRGKLDPLARYDGSVGPPGRFNGAKATLAELVKIHHCQGAPIDVGGGCEIYTHCDAGVHEGLCSIEFGGHLTGDPKQSWEFLRQFTLP